MKEIDVVWGIERSKHSDSYGELVVPIIYLWKLPGGTTVKDNTVVGRLKHGTAVTVESKRNFAGYLHYKISARHYDGTKFVRIRGWLRASLLRKMGADLFD